MNNNNTQTIRESGVLYLGLLAWIVVYCGNFWISDDAYITLRTVDNFIQGYGLRYNVIERVQTYTHPLWLFHLIVGRLLFPSPEGAVFWISLALTLLSIALLFRVAADVRTRILLVFYLLSSQAFVHYASSGLENSLGYVFITVLFYSVLRASTWSARGVFLYLLLSSLACTIRLDYSVLLFPSAVMVLWRWWQQKQSLVSCVGLSLLGISPLVLWHGFSLIYYGYVFPNTYYSKMTGAIPLILRLEQGVAYLSCSLEHDSITIFVIAYLPIVLCRKFSLELAACCGGVCFYCLYIVWIGGDFMQGRFFAVPFIAAVLLSTSYLQKISRTRGYWYILVMLLLYNGLHPDAPWKIGYLKKPSLRLTKVENEQAAYYEYSNPLFGNSVTYTLQHSFPATNGHRCVIHLTIGRLGYELGPSVHVIDPIGLTDALLSRLPIDQVPFLDHGFRAGHIIRRIPQGYIDTCVQESNVLDDPEFHAYFDKITRITQGDIFESTRWEFILQALWSGPVPLAATYEGYSIHIPITLDQANGCEVPLDYYGQHREEADRELSQVQGASSCVWKLK